MFMMPSKFEPCGLNQMYSLRYATVPIVRAVGGLDDTVENFDPVSGHGNGFKFGAYRADKFLERIYEALYAYADPDTWRKIQLNGMSVDNSWENAARKYVNLYQQTRGMRAAAGGI
jgi:starch synthase